MNSGPQFALSAALATHGAHSEFDRFASAPLAGPKRAIIDGMGVMLAARGESGDVLPFVDLARTYGGPPQSSILGFAERVALPMAALANGALAHALDSEDA